MPDFRSRRKQRKLVQWALAYIAAAFALGDRHGGGQLSVGAQRDARGCSSFASAG